MVANLCIGMEVSGSAVAQTLTVNGAPMMMTDNPRRDAVQSGLQLVLGNASSAIVELYPIGSCAIGSPTGNANIS